MKTDARVIWEVHITNSNCPLFLPAAVFASKSTSVGILRVTHLVWVLLGIFIYTAIIATDRQACFFTVATPQECSPRMFPKEREKKERGFQFSYAFRLWFCSKVSTSSVCCAPIYRWFFRWETDVGTTYTTTSSFTTVEDFHLPKHHHHPTRQFSRSAEHPHQLRNNHPCTYF